MLRRPRDTGDHHGLDAHSVWYVSGLEAQTSTVEAAESRGSHMTHNGEFEFEFEFETVNVNAAVFRTVGYCYYVLTTDILPVPCS